ncbi:MAG: hypothetical protein PHF21_02855 [Bacilli bacterium]|nr:hypothetical protein [Bacilli bacterium]
MIDEEFYFEESNPKKVFLTILTMLFVFGLCAGAYYYIDKQDNLKLKSITVELGSPLSNNIEDYIKSGKYEGYFLDTSKIHVDDEGNVDSVGEYSFTLSKENIMKKGKLYVKDTTPPIVTLKDLTIGINEDFDLDDFVESCIDLSGICNVSFVKEKDSELINKEGTYEINLKIKDKYNNEVVKKATLIVSKGFILSELKAKDKEVSNIYPQDENWKDIYTVKFKKGLDEEDEDFEEEILKLANFDFSLLYEKKIVNKTIISIFNKYNYIIGLTMKLEFDDNEVLYVPSSALEKED